MKYFFALLTMVLVSMQIRPALAQTAPSTVSSPGASPPCAQPYREGSVIDPAFASYPREAATQGLISVTVLVKVVIEADGSVSSATITKSSGNMYLDQAALKAARDTTYSPRIVNCVATRGSFLYKAVFGQGNGPSTACISPNAAAALTRAAPVRWPAGKPPSLLKATVKITLSADGVVTGASIYQSTGYDAYDKAALDAARSSIFAPALTGCKPVASTFGYEVDFDPSAPTPSPTPGH